MTLYTMVCTLVDGSEITAKSTDKKYAQFLTDLYNVVTIAPALVKDENKDSTIKTVKAWLNKKDRNFITVSKDDSKFTVSPDNILRACEIIMGKTQEEDIAILKQREDLDNQIHALQVQFDRLLTAKQAYRRYVLLIERKPRTVKLSTQDDIDQDIDVTDEL